VVRHLTTHRSTLCYAPSRTFWLTEVSGRLPATAGRGLRKPPQAMRHLSATSNMTFVMFLGTHLMPESGGKRCRTFEATNFRQLLPQVRKKSQASPDTREGGNGLPPRTIHKWDSFPGFHSRAAGAVVQRMTRNVILGCGTSAPTASRIFTFYSVKMNSFRSSLTF
jgi:hypothetical protein